jgi:putative ABC transport system ATP-binding protein
MNTIVEAKQLSKSLTAGKGEKQLVLKNINLDIMAGEFVAIMGPSGCGKSTLLYQLSGMEQQSEGQVLFKGQPLSAMSEQQLSRLRLRHMGFVFQQSNLLKNLSLLDNIVVSARLAKLDNRININNRARELMERTGIAGVADHDITQASGGQLQRAAICRALINNPDIVFGDEPTGALNSTATNAVLDILLDVNREGTAIMLVTHDAKVALKAERILYMLDGQIIAEKRLGKYNSGDAERRRRELALMDWLTRLGF